MSSLVIERAEALVLLPALTARAAARLGVRCLLIKGPVQAHHGLRDARPSVDVDLLVDPAGFRLLWEEFEGWGWTRVELSHSPTSPVHHSATFRHARWPLEIDLHHRFPGFLHPPSEVFEELWSDREVLEFGRVEVPASGWAGSVLIGALHLLRKGDPQATPEWESIVTALRNDSVHIDDVAQMAVATGSRQTAGPLFAEVGLPAAPMPSKLYSAMNTWAVRASPAPTTNITGLILLAAAPRREWPRIIWHEVCGPDEEGLRRRFPNAPAGRWGLVVMRLRRLAESVAALPTTLQRIRRARGRSRS